MEHRRIHIKGLIVTLLLTISLLVACDQIIGEDEAEPLPTLDELDLEEFQTVQVFTQNAPPPGFETIAFPEVDDNLIRTVYSQVEINAIFDGHYSDTGEPVTEAFMKVRMTNDELHVARHIQIEFVGDVFSGSSSNLDVVRLGNDYYMVDVNRTCVTDPAVVDPLANLRAGQLVGGVEFAQPTGVEDLINDVNAWQYGFDPQFINPPAVQLEASTARLDFLSGEIWVAPEHNIVMRYVVEMNVHRAKLLFGEREVTGRFWYQYDVISIGIPPNISIPNGC